MSSHQGKVCTSQMSCDVDAIESSLRTLSDVFLLMDQAFPLGKEFSDEEKKELEEINKKIKFYQQFFQRICDDHPSRKKNHHFSFHDFVPRFAQILRGFLLTHQWPQVLKWLHAITKEVTTDTDNIIWKVGLECLIQHGSQHLIQRFVRQVHVLKSLTCVEVLLDYLLHLLTLGDFLVGKDLFTDLKQSDKYYQNLLLNKRREEYYSLFHTYQGLVLYLEWKTVIKTQDCATKDVMASSDATECEAIANQALKYLVSIKDNPGVWDVFILKAIEIHEYYQNVDEARTLLTLYRENNPKSPNAHRILYEFEERNEGDKDAVLHCLKDLVALDPCNPLAITLFKLLDRADVERVRLLFNFLDFDHCKDDLHVWSLFAQLLSEINEENLTAMQEMVRTCWDVRKNWWPNYVLPCQNQSNDENPNKGSSSVLQYKRIVLEVLTNIENQRSSSKEKSKVLPLKRKRLKLK